MDILNSFTSSTAKLDIKALTNFSSLSPKAQAHLGKVYQTLTMLLALAAAGVIVQMKLQISSTLCFLGLLGLMFWLGLTPYDPFNADQQQKRLLILGGIGFLKGAVVAPIVEVGLNVDPSLVLMAFLGTTLVFGCFSVAAMSAQRRSYLFLGGMLSSAVSLLCLLSLANFFFRLESLIWVQLYGGLMVFCGYVMYDTQVIVEKASTVAHPDYIGHSLELFVDFVAIFVRILIILLQNSQQKGDKKKSRNR